MNPASKRPPHVGENDPGVYIDESNSFVYSEAERFVPGAVVIQMSEPGIAGPSEDQTKPGTGGWVGLSHESPSAVQGIPDEVLSEIFLHCNDSNDHSIHIPPQGPGSYPWYLGRVCSNWHRLMWDTPYIWSSFRISNAQKQGKYLSSDILREILSKITAIFSIIIDTPEATPILEVLIPFKTRVDRLDILQVDFSAWQHINDSASELKNSLVTLELKARKADIFTFGFTPLNFGVIPNIQNLCLDIYSGYSISRVFSRLTVFLWDQLTTLQITAMFMPMLLAQEVLQKCGSLIECTLPLIVCSFRAPDSQSISLPYLQSFTFSFDEDCTGIENFIDPLILPSLHVLSMKRYFPKGDSHLWCFHVTSLITRSGCALKKLSLDSNDPKYWNGENYGLEHLMKIQPSLEAISFQFFLHPTFFEAIRTLHLLPNLSEIQVIRLHSDGFNALLDFLDSYIDDESLSSSKNRLKYVHVVLDDSTNESDPALSRYRMRNDEYLRAGIAIDVR